MQLNNSFYVWSTALSTTIYCVFTRLIITAQHELIIFLLAVNNTALWKGFGLIAHLRMAVMNYIIRMQHGEWVCMSCTLSTKWWTLMVTFNMRTFNVHKHRTWVSFCLECIRHIVIIVYFHCTGLILTIFLSVCFGTKSFSLDSCFMTFGEWMYFSFVLLWNTFLSAYLLMHAAASCIAKTWFNFQHLVGIIAKQTLFFLFFV